MPFTTLQQPMQKSIKLAQIAFDKDEVPVGAIIINNDTQEILAQTYNLVETLKDPTAHAELLAIRAACKKLDSTYLTNCSLFVTLEPCSMCAQALAWAKISKIIFGAYDTKSGGIDHGAQIYNQETCHHKPMVIGGILEKPCKELMQKFFKDKRP